jgi:hypothetical protein
VTRGIFQLSASRRRQFVSRLLVLGAFCSSAALAQPTVKQEAAVAGSSPSPAGAAQPPDPAPPQTYRALLAGAYVLAPLLARTAGNAVSQATHSEAAAIALAGPLLLLPVGVHTYEAGGDRAGRSFAWMVGSMAVGALVMGGFGYWLGGFACEPDDEASQSCADQAQSMGLAVGGAGAMGGYIVFAVYDVINNASVPEPPSQGQPGATASFWLLPLGPERERARLGLQLGASWQF